MDVLVRDESDGGSSQRVPCPDAKQARLSNVDLLRFVAVVLHLRTERVGRRSSGAIVVARHVHRRRPRRRAAGPDVETARGRSDQLSSAAIWIDPRGRRRRRGRDRREIAQFPGTRTAKARRAAAVWAAHPQLIIISPPLSPSTLYRLGREGARRERESARERTTWFRSQ